MKVLFMKFPHISGLGKQPYLATQVLKYEDVTDADIAWLLESVTILSATDHDGEELRVVGLDTEFDGPYLGLIQLAIETRCLLIVVSKPPFAHNKRRPLNPALDRLLSNPAIRKTGCELTKDALLLRSNFGHDIRGGIDLTKLYNEEAPTYTTKGLFHLFSDMYLPESLPLRNDKATATSRWVGVPLRFAQLSYGALNAWISYKVGVYDLPGIAKAPVLDFTKANKQVLDILTDHNSAILVVEDMERKKYDSKFSTVTRLKNGQYSVLNTQFRNKLMFDDKVVMYLACGEEVTGTVVKGPHGKAKTVMPHKPIQPSENVKRITVVEQGAHRAADECLKDLFPKLVLFGDLSVSDIPFFSMLFLGDTSFKPHVAPSIKSKEHLNFYALACQTNTATRNVAVTLMKRGVEDFKIIVSDNFFVKWHEDQYKSIQDHVIESSIVKKDILDKLIGPHTVVLCSLAQLSNEKLIEVLQQRKLTHIVIDEASQISMADLPHILATYKASLQRLTFVGDPKQLAPFGSENHPSVQSVFERLPADVMLDEQYRMPHDLGSFISAYVYDGVLTSHKQPRNECSVALIDVANGKEQMLGTGFMNPKEAETVVKLILSHYLTTDFLIITPYVAQKELIANRFRDRITRLRADRKTDAEPTLADERVHTVDTVQGQEADIIVFSAVRTARMGFVVSQRRMNVALTRAKDRLIVVAKVSYFRDGQGQHSLLGAFVKEVGVAVDSKMLDEGYKLDFAREEDDEGHQGEEDGSEGDQSEVGESLTVSAR